ncbi:MAG: DUF1232 domain-containing protein [Chlorobium sp.]|nr:DUF1232 domain-containing protein [Chlorobium sp.]MCF8382212.1 DUF1232 domain-containing protein [Chlorobium sp.]
MKEGNRLFASAKKKAGTLLKDPDRTKKLLDAAFSRTYSAKNASPIFSLGEKIQAAVRMIRSYMQKEYVDIPWQTIVALTAGLIYFVSPFDALADFIPLLGFADDAAVLATVLASINQDLERFLAWERSKRDDAETAPYEIIDTADSSAQK